MADKKAPKIHVTFLGKKVTIHPKGEGRRWSGSSNVANPVLTEKRAKSVPRTLNLALLTSVAKGVSEAGIRGVGLRDGMVPQNIILRSLRHYIKSRQEDLAKITKKDIANKKKIDDFFTGWKSHKVPDLVKTFIEKIKDERKAEIFAIAVAMAKLLKPEQIAGKVRAGKKMTGEDYISKARDLLSKAFGAPVAAPVEAAPVEAVPVEAAEPDERKLIVIGDDDAYVL